MSDGGEVDRLRKQTMALSHFGGHALRTHDLDALLQEAAKRVSEATGIELVKVLELLPDRETMLVRAGLNWKLKDAADRSSILLGELQHRVRNMLLNVRTLAKRTARSSASLEAFVVAFDARLMALARTQELLTQGSAVSVRLEDTLRQELKAHGADHGSRVLLAGPELRLSPKIVQALGMAFHELATNASKYGALRQDGAQLKVSWRTVPGEQSDHVVIVWRETGVPLEDPPTRRGFGAETLERSLPYMLGGESRVEYHSDGVEWTIRFPASGNGISIPDEVED